MSTQLPKISEQIEVIGPVGDAVLESKVNWKEMYRFSKGDLKTDWGTYENVFVLDKKYYISPYWTAAGEWLELTAEGVLGYMAIGKAPNRVPPGSFAAVHCLGDSVEGQQPCGMVYLSEEQYWNQVAKPNRLWYCPNCGSAARYDDEASELLQKDFEDEEEIETPDDTPSLENCDDAGTGEGRWHGRM